MRGRESSRQFVRIVRQGVVFCYCVAVAEPPYVAATLGSCEFRFTISTSVPILHFQPRLVHELPELPEELFLFRAPSAPQDVPRELAGPHVDLVIQRQSFSTVQVENDEGLFLHLYSFLGSHKKFTESAVAQQSTQCTSSLVPSSCRLRA